MVKVNKEVILTGIRANKDLHIGNFFGALLPIVDIAKNYANNFQINLFIPDLHSFTTPIDHSSLQAQIQHNIKLFIAAGLPFNHQNVYIYRQSYISAHSELTWILDCFTGVGEMSRMTQFKDKSSSLDDNRISVGLFNYPVLMAADILLYGADYIPVGDDQTQHIEFARDIAIRINKRFGEIFKVPKPVKEQHKFFGKDQGLRIRDLQNPATKMSKSSESDKGVIFLSDDANLARKKILSAETDSYLSINYDYKKQPGVSNLLELLSLLGGTIDDYVGKVSYGDLKNEVADRMYGFINNFQTKLSQIDEKAIEAKILASEAEMSKEANKQLYKVQRAVGLR